MSKETELMEAIKNEFGFTVEPFGFEVEITINKEMSFDGYVYFDVKLSFYGEVFTLLVRGDDDELELNEYEDSFDTLDGKHIWRWLFFERKKFIKEVDKHE